MENCHLLFSFHSKVARTDLLDLPRPRLHTDNCENHPPGEIFLMFLEKVLCFNKKGQVGCVFSKKERFRKKGQFLACKLLFVVFKDLHLTFFVF